MLQIVWWRRHSTCKNFGRRRNWLMFCKCRGVGGWLVGERAPSWRHYTLPDGCLALIWIKHSALYRFWSMYSKGWQERGWWIRLLQPFCILIFVLRCFPSHRLSLRIDHILEVHSCTSSLIKARNLAVTQLMQHEVRISSCSIILTCFDDRYIVKDL